MSVSIMTGVWQIPQATITLPPDITMRRIGAEDQVRATVFYLDQYRHLIEGGEPTFRLLFDGHIAGWNYSTNARGRSLSYVAHDAMAALTRMFPFLISSLRQMTIGAVGLDGRTTGTSTVLPFNIIHTLLSQGLAAQSSSSKKEEGLPSPPIRRPFDLAENIVRLLAGDGIADNRSRVLQEWFAPWAEKNLFANKWVPSFGIESADENGEYPFPILRAASDDALMRGLKGMAEQQLGGSFWATLQSVFQLMHYEVNMVSGPSAVAMDPVTREIKGPLSMLETNPELVGGLTAYMTKPRLEFAVPPACNVLWPSTVMDHSMSEMYVTQPTRTYLGDAHLVMDFVADANMNAESATIIETALTTAYPKDAKVALGKAKAQLLAAALSSGGSSDRSDNLNNFLLEPEERFKGPVYNRLDTPSWMTFIAQGVAKTSAGAKVKEELLEVYARYEHFRARYAVRTGGVVCDFNPYVVAGFNGVILDTQAPNMHTYGYFQTVQHTLSGNSMTTSISYDNGIPFDEFFELLDAQDKEMSYAGLESMDMVPLHPIYQIRDQFQKKDPARAYYKNMLWRNEDPLEGQDHIFDVDEILGVLIEEGGKRYIEDLEYKDPDFANALPNDATGYYPSFVPKPQYAARMTDAETAYAHASRPLCTLEEFIDLHKELGVRIGPVSATDRQQGKGAPYYVKILDYIPGPTLPKLTGVDGEPCEPGETQAGDTRRDWERRFIEFRRKVYFDPAPFEA